MLAGYHRKVETFVINDPGADKRLPVLRVPTGHTYTVERAFVVPDTSVDAGTDAWSVSLENGGTSGTAQTVIGGTAGGTVGWTACTPKEITITSGSGDLTEGQYLVVNYAEDNTVAPGNIAVIVEIVDGIGSKA